MSAGEIKARSVLKISTYCASLSSFHQEVFWTKKSLVIQKVFFLAETTFLDQKTRAANKRVFNFDRGASRSLASKTFWQKRALA